MSYVQAFCDFVERLLGMFGITLIPEWRQTLRMYSFYAYAAIGLLPQLWNLAIAHDLLANAPVPPIVAWGISALSFIGVAVRLIKQKALELQVESEV